MVTTSSPIQRQHWHDWCRWYQNSSG